MLGPQLIHDSPLVSYQPSGFVVPRAEPVVSENGDCVTSFQALLPPDRDAFPDGLPRLQADVVAHHPTNKRRIMETRIKFGTSRESPPPSRTRI